MLAILDAAHVIKTLTEAYGLMEPGRGEAKTAIDTLLRNFTNDLNKTLFGTNNENN